MTTHISPPSDPAVGGPPDDGAQAAPRPARRTAAPVQRQPQRERARRRRAGLTATRAGNRRGGRVRHIALKLVLVGIAVVLLLGAAGAIAVYAVYQNFRGQLPDAATLTGMEPPQDSYVYDRDGNLISVLHGDQRHEHAALAEISRFARLATVDIEDRHFYSEGSWDLPRIVKAGYDDLRGGAATQGASTITQQLAKISFLGFGSRSLDYKIKEVLLGIEIENNFSKDQILEMYLNRIEYGNHSVGIESAALSFFHEHARDLDLAQAALLAALPNSPTVLYPLNHPDGQSINPLAKQRQKLVLDAMVNNGDITFDQAAAAAAEPLSFHYVGDNEPAPNDFSLYVRAWLDNHFGGAYLNPGGWQIHSTLNPPQQAFAQRTVADGVNAVADKNAHDGALVAIDPRTGEIMSMVGTADPNNPDIGQYNAATAEIQPGSTIKLFTYTAAIASRLLTMRSTIVDQPTSFPQAGAPDYKPQNYDRRYHGPCQLQACLGNSFNIPAVKVERKVGIPFITDLEIAMGLTSLSQPDNRPAPDQWAATLGGLHQGVAPLELAVGAATLADMGVHHEPTPVVSIMDAGGRTVYTHDANAASNRVVPEGVAYIMNQMTSNDHNRTIEFGPNSDLTLPDRRVSAKTGTTENFVANWTVGWTPDLVSVVWVGNSRPSCLRPEDRATLVQKMQSQRLYADQSPDDPFTPSELAAYGLKPVNSSCGHLVNSSGITGAAPIWNTFMRGALVAPVPWYQRPQDVLQQGSGDDAYFYLPGTVASYDESHCYHGGNQPDPGDQCLFAGGATQIFPPSPPPSATPAPSPPPGQPAPAPPAAPPGQPNPAPSNPPAPPTKPPG